MVSGGGESKLLVFEAGNRGGERVPLLDPYDIALQAASRW